jgi:hypothetical protein
MRILTSAALAFGALLLAACGAATADEGMPAPDCAPEYPDCVDTIDVVDGDDGDEFGADFDADSAREAARATLGTAEGELDAVVRVSRRGDENYMLTEDYVFGRLTVDLDADADGVYRVVSVVVELPEGPETYSG